MKRIQSLPFRHATSVCRRGAYKPKYHPNARWLHISRPLEAVKPFLLADIGEGITEVQIVQWFVQPGAQVEQFDKLCEVQSDKASVEITSRFDGVIKKLHYEADEMAIVGKPLLDIDIQNELSEADEAATSPPEEGTENPGSSAPEEKAEPPRSDQGQTQQQQPAQSEGEPSKGSGSAKLATPAVRRLTREHSVNLDDISGTGKDGRVLKEDVQNYIDAKSSSSAPPTTSTSDAVAPEPVLEDKTINLTPVQNQMFKQMTKSLNIPHFLYSDSINVTAINALRHTLNSNRDERISLLPFLIKAVSLAMSEYPLLNARLDTTSDPKKPQIVLRAAHNIGIAVDSPQGLLVPVIKGVQVMSVETIAQEARRLASLAREGKLTSNDMSGGTFSVSNVGSIGGGVVAPVIVESQLAIVGVGRTKAVPAFNDDGDVVRREECALSWSADHRVLDGATVARCAERVRQFVESPETMLVRLR